MPFDEDDYWDVVRDEYEEQRFLERVSDEIALLADAHFNEIFSSRVVLWAEENWPVSEATAYRVGTRGRQLANDGLSEPAVVWAATCIEIIVRELIIKPVFVGLFIGGDWVESAVDVMVGNRWGSKETLKLAREVLLAIADLDVTSVEVGATRIWSEIANVLAKRNRIVHRGEEATPQEATLAVDVAAGLYGGVLPTMRELCGMPDIIGYSPPEAGATP